jgi:hypothetical protein
MRCLFAVLMSFSCGLGLLYAQTAPDQALAAVRQYALNYAKSLPDYTCTRVIQRRDSPVAAIYASSPELFGQTPPGSDRRWTWVIEEELTVSAQRENYKVVKIDNDLPPRARAMLLPEQSTISVTEFASVLERIFDPETAASIHFDRRDKLRSRPVQVFSFEVPRAHGERVFDRAVEHEVAVGYKGRLYADAETNAVLRVETSTSDFPSDSEFIGIDLALDYKPAKIGGREFALPYRFDVQWHRHLPNARTKVGPAPQESSVEAEYKNYRAFSAQSDVTFPANDDVHSTITFGEIATPEKK